MSLSKNKPNRPYQHGAVLSKSRQARVRAPKSESTREGCRTQRVIRRERERERGAGKVCLIVGREFAKGEQDDGKQYSELQRSVQAGKHRQLLGNFLFE